MSCDPEAITGYVDDVLEPSVRAALEVHLTACAACQAQVAFEADLRERLRSLPAPEPRPGFEAEVRRRLREPRRSRARVWLAAAAIVAALMLWGRGTAPFVVWELARDHAHCFGFRPLPAEVWSNDPAYVQNWFEKAGTPLPLIPDGREGFELVGGRDCSLLDRSVAHLYYVSGDRHVSLFAVPGQARFGRSYHMTAQGVSVHLLRVTNTVIGIASEHESDVLALEQAFVTTMASARGLPVEAPPPLTSDNLAARASEGAAALE